MLRFKSNSLLHIQKYLPNNIFHSFPRFSTIAQPPLISTFHPPKNQQLKVNLKKRLFYKIYDQQRNLLEDNLFDMDKNLPNHLSTEQKQTLYIVKHWLSGQINLKSIDSDSLHKLISISKYLISSKHPQINRLSSSLSPVIRHYQISSDNLQSTLQLLQFVLKINKQLSQHLSQKLYLFLQAWSSNTDSKVNIIKKLIDHNLHQFMPLILKNFNSYQILKYDIKMQHLPIQFISHYLQSFTNYIIKKINSGNINNNHEIVKILNIVKQLPSNQYTLAILTHLAQLHPIKNIHNSIISIKQYLKIVSAHPLLNLLILYDLLNHEVNIYQSFRPQKYAPFDKQPIPNQIILTLIILQTNNKQYLQKINQLPINSFKTLQQFLKTFNNLKLIPYPQLPLHYTYKYLHRIRQLDMPFRDQKIRWTNYIKSKFIQYLFMVYNSTKQFIKQHNNKITIQVLQEAIRLHINQIQSIFIYERYYLYLCTNKIKIAVMKQKKQFLKVGLLLLCRYKDITIQRKTNEYTQSKVWRLIERYILHIKQILNLGLSQQIYQLLKEYSTSQNSYYKFDHRFRTIINQLLPKLDIIYHHSSIFYLVIRQALKSNLILPSHLTQIAHLAIDYSHFTPSQTFKLRALRSQPLLLTSIDYQSIQALLTNNHYSTFIQERYQQILDFFANKCKLKETIKCLNAYNLRKSVKNTKILELLINAIKNVTKTKDNIHMIDFYSIMNRCLSNGNYDVQGYVKLWQMGITNYISSSIQVVTFQWHTKMIKYIITQPSKSINEQILNKYLKSVIIFLQNRYKGYKSTFSKMHLLLILINYKFTKNKIEQIIQQLFISQQAFIKQDGIFLMLLLNKYYRKQQRKQMLSKFINLKKNYQYIYDLHYQYLITKYKADIGKIDQISDISQLKKYIFTHPHPPIYSIIINIICDKLKFNQERVNLSSNQLIKIKSTIIVPLSPYKNQSIVQHDLIRDIIKTIKSQNKLQIVMIRYHRAQTYIREFINTLLNQSTLLKKQQSQLIVRILSQQKYNNSKLTSIQHGVQKQATIQQPQQESDSQDTS